MTQQQQDTAEKLKFDSFGPAFRSESIANDAQWSITYDELMRDTTGLRTIRVFVTTGKAEQQGQAVVTVWNPQTLEWRELCGLTYHDIKMHEKVKDLSPADRARSCGAFDEDVRHLLDMAGYILRAEFKSSF